MRANSACRRNMISEKLQNSQCEFDSMHKYFLKKTWGFNSETHPIVGFELDGSRIRYLQESTDKDWVLIAGTESTRTPEIQKLRLLAKVKLGRTDVDSEQVLNQIGNEIDPNEYNPDGTYKWPYALPMVEAHIFDGFPKLIDVFGSNLPKLIYVKNAWNIEKDKDLSGDIVQQIDELPTTQVPISDIPELRRVSYRKQFSQLQKRDMAGGLTGPEPVIGSQVHEYIETEAFTYLLKLEGQNSRGKSIFKVGWTKDLKNRIRTLNHGLLTPVTGYEWTYVSHYNLDSCLSAFTFEQLIHDELKQFLVEGRREEYSIRYSDINRVIEKLEWQADFMFPEIQSKYEKLYQESLNNA